MKPERAETLPADDAPEWCEGITRTTKMREDIIRLSHFSFYIWEAGQPAQRHTYKRLFLSNDLQDDIIVNNDMLSAKIRSGYRLQHNSEKCLVLERQ